MDRFTKSVKARMDPALKKWLLVELGYSKEDRFLAAIGAGRNHDLNLINSQRVVATPSWFERKQIRVYVDPSIPSRNQLAAMQYVWSGIQELIDQLDLDMNPWLVGVDNAVNGYIEEARDGNAISPDIIGELASRESHRDPQQGGMYHADVVISNKRLTTGNWGWCVYSSGTMVIGYPPLTGNTLTGLAKHESTHFFGNRVHHKDNVAASKGKTTHRNLEVLCVGDREFPTKDICPLCYDQLVGLWIKNEKEYRERHKITHKQPYFFKT